MGQAICARGARRRRCSPAALVRAGSACRSTNRCNPSTGSAALRRELAPACDILVDFQRRRGLRYRSGARAGTPARLRQRYDGLGEYPSARHWNRAADRFPFSGRELQPRRRRADTQLVRDAARALPEWDCRVVRRMRPQARALRNGAGAQPMPPPPPREQDFDAVAPCSRVRAASRPCRREAQMVSLAVPFRRHRRRTHVLLGDRRQAPRAGASRDGPSSRVARWRQRALDRGAPLAACTMRTSSFS